MKRVPSFRVVVTTKEAVVSMKEADKSVFDDMKVASKDEVVTQQIANLRMNSTRAVSERAYAS